MSRCSNAAPSGTFFLFPVERSSTTSTWSPRAENAAATCEPMKPAPPVTTTRTRRSSSSELDGRSAPRVLDHIGKDPVQIERRAPTDCFADLFDRRLTVQHVLDAQAVDLRMRDKRELGIRTGQLEHAAREIEDPHPLR